VRTYIQPLKKQSEDEMKVRVDRDVLQGLRDYCEFLQSPQSYVVTEVLRKALRKDKAFTAWRAQRNGSDNGAAKLAKSPRDSRGLRPAVVTS
jgi:hypothetical protein